jgi:hypothetical protein
MLKDVKFYLWLIYLPIFGLLFMGEKETSLLGGHWIWAF